MADPQYQRIENWLRDVIASAAPGDMLPSESDLAARFSVSRMTARQAVQNLAVEGLVVRRRGAGTFIADRPIHRAGGPLLNFSSEMRRRHKKPSSRLLYAGLRDAKLDEIERLKLPENGRVVLIQRLRLADGVPIAIESAALPLWAAGVLGRDLENGSLHEALIEVGHVPTTAHTWISARPATAQEAELLDVIPREPVLVERRIVAGAASEPVEHTESVYAASRFVIDAVYTFGATTST